MHFADEFSNNTQIKRYLENVNSTLEKYQNSECWNRYHPLLQENPIDDTLPLSVILRTQGKRQDELRESLLCLKAQENQNFEIILIGHKVALENESGIQVILDELDPFFRKKIRYIPLKTGGRAAPLNLGFAVAHGRYTAIYDDDDVLFANWSKGFIDAIEENDGRILHQYAFSQKWKRNGDGSLCALEAPKASYCTPFKQVEQLVVNRCPLMTLAFPTVLFKNYGISFDESLNVTEDWHFFMRCAFICGVTDIPEATAIYRFWENVESSATLHGPDEWQETYRRIQNEFSQNDVIFPANTSIPRIISLFEEENRLHEIIQNENTPVARLYYSSDGNYSNDRCVTSPIQWNAENFDVWFVLKEKLKEFTSLRFDIQEDGMIWMQNLEITVWLLNGEKAVISPSNCRNNGFSYLNGIMFIPTDPEVIWDWVDPRQVDVVHISGIVSHNPPYSKWFFVFCRIWSKLSQIKHKIQEKIRRIY